MNKKRGTKLILGLLVVLGLGVSSCKMNDDFSKNVEENVTAIQQYMAANYIDAEEITDGIYIYKSVENPGGREPQLGEQATYIFKTYTLDGRIIDSTRSTYSKTPVGTGLYQIVGIEYALVKLREGEKATFLLTFYNAYGANGWGNSGTYAPVRLEIQMVKLLSETEQIDEYISTKGYTPVERRADGLILYRQNTVAGDTLGVGKAASVVYTGKVVADESTFDSGTYSFTTGAGTTIQGFDRAVRNMRKGEKAIAIFPSSLGYGKSYQVKDNKIIIPPYAPLLFELTINP